MRVWMCGLLAVFAMGLGGTTSAAAPARIEATDGRCSFSVNNGLIGAGARCSKATVLQDSKTGDVTLRLDFPEGLSVDLIGSGMQINATWLMTGVGRMAWTNPGAPVEQDLLNAADSPRDQLVGQCAIGLQEKGTRIYEIYCGLQTALGTVKIEYKAPKAEDKSEAKIEE